MSTVIRGLAWVVAVCCVVWVAVLWRWQTTGRDVAAPDLVVYLLVLPGAVLLLAWALRWAWRGAAARESARASAAAAAGSGASAGAPALAEASHEAERQWAWRLHAAHLNCPCAQDADALLQAGMKGQPLPALDPELVNQDGLPVLSTRIADLPLDDVRQALAELAAPAAGGAPADDAQAQPRQTDPAHDGASATTAAPAPLEWSDHQVRALAALAPALEQALDGLATWASNKAAPPPLTAREPQGRHLPVRTLQVRMALPAAWSGPHREQAAAWAQAESRKRWQSQALGVQVSATAVDGTELWAEADQALLAAARQRDDMRLLLLACHSDLSEDAIAALESERRLFIAGQQPRGLIPGEAAAALVLAPPELAPRDTRDVVPPEGAARQRAGKAGPPAPGTPAAPPADAPPPPLALVPRAALAQRDKPIEAGGPVSSQVLGQVLEQALSAAALKPDGVAAVVCDADSHTPRATELFGTTLKALPHLDPAEQLCRLGTVTAHGAAGALLVVAAAAARTVADAQPCLALALGDSHQRLALLLRPVPPGPEAGGAGVSHTSTATAPEARR